MKKLISIILVLTLLMLSSAFAFAGESNGIYIIKDNKNVRIIKEVRDDGIFYVTFDKRTGSFELSNSVGKKIFIEGNTDKQLDLNSTFELATMTRSSVQMKENTWTNFEYTKYTNDTWQLRRPNNGIWSTYSTDIRETSSNRSDLQRYQDLVEDLNLLEGAYFLASAGAGASILVAVGAAIGSAGTASAPAILVASGATGAMLAAGYAVINKAESCYDQYFEIRQNYSSDIL